MFAYRLRFGSRQHALDSLYKRAAEYIASFNDHENLLKFMARGAYYTLLGLCPFTTPVPSTLAVQNLHRCLHKSTIERRLRLEPINSFSINWLERMFSVPVMFVVVLCLFRFLGREIFMNPSAQYMHELQSSLHTVLISHCPTTIITSYSELLLQTIFST